MATKQAEWWKTRGTCSLCKKQFDKSGMARHLEACLAKHPPARIGKKQAAEVDVLHLVVEGPHASPYWLHLDVESDALLGELDVYLRHLWLECCGHLSEFRRKRKARLLGFFNPDDDGLDMEVPLGEAIKPQETLDYTYDFGSSTELIAKAVSQRRRPRGKSSILLLARNRAPAIPCGGCEQGVAKVVCTQCSWETDGWLCSACAKKHARGDCGGEFFLKVVNSPRTGICAYE